ncbi:MAG: TIGR03943 family putative permease subunit [Rhodoglobus sp.]
MSLIGIVSVSSLALTDRLGFYIHPRYYIFTVVMAVIAAVFVVLAFAFLPSTGTTDEIHDAHGSDHHKSSHPRSTGWWCAVSVVLVAATAVALLVLPPETLTTSTVKQRALNGSVATTSSEDSQRLVGGDYNSFTVKDWAGLLRQGVDDSYFVGKTPTLVGFATADVEDSENIFYVARFMITCCAVDAQPIGVPVYLPGWQDQYDTDDWLSVTGSFIPNPSGSSMQPLVLSPANIVATDQPSQPYVY